MIFAKTLESPRYGQVVAMKTLYYEEDGDDFTSVPAVNIHFYSLEYGVSAITMMFEDSEKGMNDLQAAFDMFSVSIAEDMIDAFMKGGDNVH